MFKELFTESSTYMLIDYDRNKMNSFDYHGDTYKIISVTRDSVIAEGPDGEEDEFDIDEIKSQDKFVKDIRKV